MKKVFLVLIVSILVLIMGVAGCYVSPRHGYGKTYGTSYSYGGYSPSYYYGNLVYFDTVGRPYYYRSGYRSYVPTSWRNYNSSIRYYRANRYRYSRWHTRYHRTRYYRRAVRSRNYRRNTYRRNTYRRNNRRRIRYRTRTRTRTRTRSRKRYY